MTIALIITKKDKQTNKQTNKQTKHKTKQNKQTNKTKLKDSGSFSQMMPYFTPKGSLPK